MHDADHPDCLNCGTTLRGQYCGNCGQRAQSRLISLWELMRDAFGDLFELDSRLWRTLRPLMVSPGVLTRDYLEGRRARYMPPFRMYLVLSLLFFAIVLFNPRDDLAMLYVPEAEPASEQVEDEADVHIPTECSVDNEDLESSPQWIQRRATPERLKKICERITLDEGETFFNLLLDNLPVALIVLLPLMALVLKMLYPLSRRFFVEHLLFFVHFHAFFFLMLTLMNLFSRIGGAIPFMPGALITLTLVVASFYVPVYLYKAMRVVYDQGHVVTVFKYSLLLTAYIFGVSMTFVGAVLFALISVGE